MKKKESETDYCMEDKHNHNYQPNNGFLMGAILGAAVTLLFTTKKGREIVRELSDKSFEKLSEWEDVMQAQELVDDESNDYIEPAEVDKLRIARRSVSKIESDSSLVNISQKNKSVVKSVESRKSKPHSGIVTAQKGKVAIRRFFKGSKNN